MLGFGTVALLANREQPNEVRRNTNRDKLTIPTNNKKRYDSKHRQESAKIRSCPKCEIFFKDIAALQEHYRIGCPNSIAYPNRYNLTETLTTRSFGHGRRDYAAASPPLSSAALPPPNEWEEAFLTQLRHLETQGYPVSKRQAMKRNEIIKERTVPMEYRSLCDQVVKRPKLRPVMPNERYYQPPPSPSK